MMISRLISRHLCLLFILLIVPYSSGGAQDRFDERDMARSADIYGYTTYHDYATSDTRPRHDYEVAPILNPLGGQVRVRKRVAGSVDGGREISRSPVRHNGKPSKIEMFYREKTGENQLEQQYYNLLRTPSVSSQQHISNGSNGDQYITQPVGIVQGDYIIQSGDELTVMFYGERKDRQTYKIDTDGRLLINNFPDLMAVGKTSKAVERELQDLADSYGYQGSVKVSVSGMRQIGILIAGQVAKPGRHMMNNFHSVLDALQMAGGVLKSGSLRQIKFIRKGKAQHIDLYRFFISGFSSFDMALQDGDRIIVPLLGPTVAVTGDVKQAGIFELKSDPRLAWRGGDGNKAQTVTVDQALSMAGGVLSAGQNEYILTDAGSRIRNVENRSGAIIGDGSVLQVVRATDRLDNAVRLAGYTRQNGLYDVTDTPTLESLLNGKNVFGENIYPLIGVIARANPKTLTRTMIGFSPQGVAQGREGKALQGGDTVYLFSYDDIVSILNENEVGDDRGGRIADNSNEEVYPRLVRHFVRDNTVTVNGAVWEDGAWPVGGTASVGALLSAAGGTTQKADTDKIEIVKNMSDKGADRMVLAKSGADLNAINVAAGDQIRVPEEFKQLVESAVTLSGEVRNPGTYDLMRGETLLSVIERAGGLTVEAYAPGAIFSRQSERRREEQKFRAAAQNLEQTISVNLNAKDKDADLTPAQIALARDLAEDLKNIQAVGRITVEADPAVLRARPELNLLLEDGDRIHFPKRPMNVRVSGEVMHSASLLFESDKDIDDYLAEAGGLTYYADQSRKFIVYPDGAAQPVGGWNDKRAMIIPGSTIVVPRDPKPFSFIDSFKDITQILTNMAITGVFVEDIASDDN